VNVHPLFSELLAGADTDNAVTMDDDARTACQGARYEVRVRTTGQVQPARKSGRDVIAAPSIDIFLGIIFGGLFVWGLVVRVAEWMSSRKDREGGFGWSQASETNGFQAPIRSTCIPPKRRPATRANRRSHQTDDSSAEIQRPTSAVVPSQGEHTGSLGSADQALVPLEGFGRTLPSEDVNRGTPHSRCSCPNRFAARPLLSP
jgi:hypothetical protein